MEDWKTRLEHARADRDALVACGNRPPEKPDPEGSVIEVRARVFNGNVYWQEMRKRGHTSIDFGKCSCRSDDGRQSGENNDE